MSSSSPRKLISLQNVGVKYHLKKPINGSRSFWAVQDISLNVHEGENLGILGSNGAGKSTLMRLLGGIIAPDRGKVWRDRRAKITLLSLGVGFESNLTGRENAILNGMILGLHRRTIEKKLDQIKEFSELGNFFEQPVYMYSSGMFARLGFSIALQANPDVLLVDEVLSVGDHAFQQKSSAAIRERMADNKTVVLISHDFEMIKKICQKVVCIDRGRTTCEGNVEEVGKRLGLDKESKNDWKLEKNKQPPK